MNCWFLVSDDRHVKKLKGESGPVFTAEARAGVLNELRSVDGVIVHSEQMFVPLLLTLRPRLFVKGTDYDSISDAVSVDIARHGIQTQLVGNVELRSLSTTWILSPNR